MAFVRHPASMQILSESLEETWGHVDTACCPPLVLFSAWLSNVHGNSHAKMHKTATGRQAGY